MKKVYVMLNDPIRGHNLVEFLNAEFKYQYGDSGAWVYNGEELLGYFPQVMGVWIGSDVEEITNA